MAVKDITEKNFEDFEDVFADIVNVLLFKGKRLMKENELEAATTKSMLKIDGKIHEQERDVSKFWKNGEVRISILGFENQTAPDSLMPLRIMGYDGASYKKQVNDKKLKKRYPVATLVLYFGTETKWTAPKNLCGCFEIPEELKPFVSDYKINVFEIAWLDDKTINMFQSDFKFVAKYFQAKRLNKDYEPSNEELKHADELMKLFTALTGDNSFEEVYNSSKLNNKKGGFTMDDVIARIENRGKEEIILRLIESNAGTIEQIAEWVKLPVEEVKRIAQKVPVMG
jgi:hypothetical protein